MKKKITIFLLFVMYPIHAATITPCTARNNSEENLTFNFEIQDYWETNHIYTQLVIPEIGVYTVIYSSPGGYTLVGHPADHENKYTLVELNFDTNFTDGTIRLGEKIPPRNFMGKFFEYNISCTK